MSALGAMPGDELLTRRAGVDQVNLVAHAHHDYQPVAHVDQKGVAAMSAISSSVMNSCGRCICWGAIRFNYPQLVVSMAATVFRAACCSRMSTTTVRAAPMPPAQLDTRRQ